jgi:hypothetical protein
MAYYKYPQLFTHLQSDEFDTLREPGSPAGWSGIYKCEGCGKEAVSTAGHPLPPQNHHQHTLGQGRIRWRIIVTDKP